jgi:hypothetical protein
MDNQEIKEELTSTLKNLLEKISQLSISLQTKLKIVRLYVPTQFNFQLRLYNFSQTWLQNELDSLITNYIRSWLQYPINSCVSEIIHLPLSYGGLGIPSLKAIAAKHNLSVRAGLRDNEDPNMKLLWEITSPKHIPTDTLLLNSTFSEACHKLSQTSLSSSLIHIKSLVVQGPSISAINSELEKKEIKRWSNFSLSLPDSTFKFLRKALQQQLATAANMQRWHRTGSNLCSLCQSVQTNKHVLSNCSFPGSLARYSDRHNSILKIIFDYLMSVLPSSFTIYVDLPTSNPINTIFNTLRPDLAILYSFPK